MAYRDVYSPAAEAHLRVLTARQRAIAFDAVDEQLIHAPGIETSNRKPMRPNPTAPWELRAGEIRVNYDIAEEPEPVVTVLAVGGKDGHRIIIGGKEIQL